MRTDGSEDTIENLINEGKVLTLSAVNSASGPERIRLLWPGPGFMRVNSSFSFGGRSDLLLANLGLRGSVLELVATGA